jgi:hypothetical protein
MFLTDIADYIAEKGYGEVAVDIFIDKLPNDPDNLIALAFATSSTVGSQHTEILYSFQVRVRNQEYDVAYGICNSIFKEFHNQSVETSTGRKFVTQKTQPPYFLMYDESDRANFVTTIYVLSNRD